ncbi:Hypothetical protein Eab7_1106 [Exiguobacterium antarcticum B7]|nr:Hypothetical protein Eab7_1106 [Exiguobacterium antarcticum B7]
MLIVSVLGLEYKGFVQDSCISEEIRQTFEQLIPFRSGNTSGSRLVKQTTDSQLKNGLPFIRQSTLL